MAYADTEQPATLLPALQSYRDTLIVLWTGTTMLGPAAAVRGEAPAAEDSPWGARADHNGVPLDLGTPVGIARHGGQKRKGRHMATTETNWRVIDFRPAPPGWRAMYVLDNNGQPDLASQPLAGWLIQEECRGYDRTGRFVTVEAEPDDRMRRIVAAELTGVVPGEVVEVGANVWMVLGPEQPDPSREQVLAEYGRQRPGRAVEVPASPDARRK
jgi:hypothetical protein